MLLGIFKKKGEVFDYWTFTIFGAGFSCFVSSYCFAKGLAWAKPRLFLIFLDLLRRAKKKQFDSHNPIVEIQWFRLFPFRSPLLRESLLLSFPLATEMFQFTRLPRPFL